MTQINNMAQISEKADVGKKRGWISEVCGFILALSLTLMFALPMLAIGVGMALGILRYWFHLWG